MEIREKLLSGNAAANFAMAGVTTVNPMEIKYKDNMAMVSLRPTWFLEVLIQNPPFSFQVLFCAVVSWFRIFRKLQQKSIFSADTV